VNVVITGGGGFLGQRLAGALLRRGTLTGADGAQQAIARLTLVDTAFPAGPSDDRVQHVTGDVADRALLERIISARGPASERSESSIFHLAAVVSGQAEADFDLGMRVNVDATRLLLEVCRARGHTPRVVFASSVAVFGGTLPDAVAETTAVTPQTSYGMEKAIGELLVNDYSRRGFVDGRVLRLPTICVRPGRPNAAASSFASGIIREPLNGEISVCPTDPDARVALASPAVAIDCFIAAHELPSERLGFSRIVNVPAISISVGEMVAALARVAGADVANRVRWERDARIAKMVAGWPGAVDASRARALGFPIDENIDALIRQYMRDVLKRPSE
jgi:nucleoside-diphosphate-sugar epimerase